MSRKLTDKQVEANRLRAANSTGPRTPEGKARSSMNALKHGMFAETLLLPNENNRLLDEISRQFYEDFPPANMDERMCLEQMIFAQWRLLRVARSRMPDADWDTDLARSLGQSKIYSSIYRDYAKSAAQLDRSRSKRGVAPPDVERENGDPIPVNPYDDPLSQVNAVPKKQNTNEIQTPGFVPANRRSEPPARESRKLLDLSEPRKREKLPYEYDQSEFAPWEKQP